MFLVDVLPDPSKDDVTIYEVPNLNLPDSVLLPVFSGFWSPRTYYSYSNRFEEFGIPFYIVLTPQEVTDYDRIYEKIRNKYSQFSTAEELHQPPPERVEESLEEDERSVDDVMQEVVLTRQELNQNQTMVIIRHQPFSKFMSRFGDVEMPVNTDKVEQLLDLKEILRPRMQSTAPSAMESVHRDVSSTPPESQNGEAIQPDSLDDQPEHTGQGGFEVVGVGEIQDGSEGMYFGQRGTYVDPSSINDPQEHNSFEPLQENDTFDPPDENNSFDEHDGSNAPQSSAFDDPDQTFLGADTTLTNQVDPDLDHSESGLRFSESDVLNIDDENRSLPSMIDSEDNIPPSQLGRAHAPSPAVTDILPSYAQLYPTSSDPQSTFDHTFKFGDALVCEWTVPAFDHIFGSSKAHWDTFEAWTDPSPPVADSAPKKLHLDLDDCLDEFAREEELGQDDLWYCPRCKEHRQAKKTLQLWRVPDIFAVHLKRFSANRGFRDKLDNLIEFPLVDLDLTDRVGDKKWIADERGGEKLVYDLFAVDNHYGGLGGGHYTAYAQNFVDGKWYYFDGNNISFKTLLICVDSNVRPARAEDTVTAAAYLLFYRRRSESPLGGNTSKLIADALALKSEESSDSTTPSPKVDDRSATPSPVPLLTNINPLNTFIDSRSIESIYSPLRNLASTTTLWKGGWSSRANTGFNFGTSTMMQTESPSVQSQNITSEDHEEVDLTNDEEIEVVGMEDMAENDEADVQLIRLDPMDGDQTA